MSQVRARAIAKLGGFRYKSAYKSIARFHRNGHRFVLCNTNRAFFEYVWARPNRICRRNRRRGERHDARLLQERIVEQAIFENGATCGICTHNILLGKQAFYC